MRSTKLGLLLAVTTASTLSLAPSATADKLQSGHCARVDKVKVKGAEMVKTARLTDLTTAGTVATGHANARRRDLPRPASGDLVNTCRR